MLRIQQRQRRLGIATTAATFILVILSALVVISDNGPSSLKVFSPVSFAFGQAVNVSTTTRAPTKDEATQPLYWWVILLAALIAFPVLLLSCYFLLMWQQKALHDYKGKYEEMLKVLGENTRRVQEQVNAAKKRRKLEALAEAELERAELGKMSGRSIDADDDDGDDDGEGKGGDEVTGVEAEDIARALVEARNEIREGLLRGGRANMTTRGPMAPVSIPEDWRVPLDRTASTNNGRAIRQPARTYILSSSPIYLSPTAIAMSGAAAHGGNSTDQYYAGSFNSGNNHRSATTPPPPLSSANVAAKGGVLHTMLNEQQSFTTREISPTNNGHQQPTNNDLNGIGLPESATVIDPMSFEAIAADTAAAHRSLRDLKKTGPLRHLESLI